MLSSDGRREKEGEREGGREGREVGEEWIDAGTGGGGVWLGEDGE